MNFNQVMFELSCKMVIDKINIACEDLIELRNIVVECRKILISHPSYVLWFVKRQVNGVAHELARVTPLFPNLYSITHVIFVLIIWFIMKWDKNYIVKKIKII